MTDQLTHAIDTQIARHGEPYRRLFTQAMTWFAERHPELSIDWDRYADDLVEHAVLDDAEGGGGGH